MSQPAEPGHPVPERFEKRYRTEPLILKGLIVVFGLFGGLIAWSALASIQGAVIGQGIVSLESNVKNVQHLDGGIVAAIHVREGERVKAGDVLITLEGTAHEANEAIVATQLRLFLARRARLETERDGAAEILFPAQMLALAKTDPDVAKLVRGERRLFAARRASWSGEVRMLRERIRQHREEAKGARAQLVAKRKQSELNRDEALTIAPLQKKRLVTKTRMLALAREAARLQGEEAGLAGQIAGTKGAIAEVELRIAQIGKAALESIVAELRELEGKIAEAKERQIILADKLRHINIRAPRSGRVHELAVHTIGGVISPAEPIMYIVPDEDRLILKVRINPADIDLVKLNMPATISFSSLNAYKTLTFSGRVITRAAAASRDDVTGANFYNLIVEIDADELKKIDSKDALVPDLPAEVFLQTGARTVLSYVLKPLADQLARALRED